MRSRVNSGTGNFCYLYLNGVRQSETIHYSYSESGQMYSTGGRIMTLEASAGDEIEIRATGMIGGYYDILYCAEYMPKM